MSCELASLPLTALRKSLPTHLPKAARLAANCCPPASKYLALLAPNYATGSSRLRKALYFPAIAAQQHNPLIRPLCLRLHEQGKCQLFILCAAMRKLLHLAFGVIKSNSPFDPHFLDKNLKIA
jgi:hypothetical protein